jgi:hypothetical protein
MHNDTHFNVETPYSFHQLVMIFQEQRQLQVITPTPPCPNTPVSKQAPSGNQKTIMTSECIVHQPRFLKTRPARVVAGAAGFAAAVVFFASPLAVPLVKEAKPFLLAAAVVVFEVAVFLTTVLVLPSLASLVKLARRPSRVAGLDGGALGAAGAAARRVLVAGAGGGGMPAELELVLDVVVTFLVPTREDLAFSTILESMFVAMAERLAPFKGDPGRAIWDFAGDSGRILLSRELDDVGDRTCPGRTAALSGAWPRVFFLGFSIFSISFSLSWEMSPLSRKSAKPSDYMSFPSLTLYA